MCYSLRSFEIKNYPQEDNCVVHYLVVCTQVFIFYRPTVALQLLLVKIQSTNENVAMMGLSVSLFQSYAVKLVEVLCRVCTGG